MDTRAGEAYTARVSTEGRPKADMSCGRWGYASNTNFSQTRHAVVLRVNLLDSALYKVTRTHGTVSLPTAVEVWRLPPPTSHADRQGQVIADNCSKLW